MRKEYERPDVQMVPVSMESIICESNGVLQTIIIADPYDGEDLG